jgi:hypothetical protein
MLQIAQIRSEHGALLLPAGDPYDRELVFQEAEFRARRHGTVGLRIGSAEMRVACSELHSRVQCAGCLRSVGSVSYVVHGQRLCTNCAKRSV